MNRDSLDRLLHAMLTHVDVHPAPAVEKFKAAVSTWGSERIEVSPASHPAIETLESVLSQTSAETRDLTEMVVGLKAELHWQQTYTEDDDVDASLLAGYVFSELIGPGGPYVSDKVRVGVGFWGPNVCYPSHAHEAEEIYQVLAGAAEFQQQDGPWQHREAGDVIYYRSKLWHGFRTGAEPLFLFYMWQAGEFT